LLPLLPDTLAPGRPWVKKPLHTLEISKVVTYHCMAILDFVSFSAILVKICFLTEKEVLNVRF
jgi:hypothetical protein